MAFVMASSALATTDSFGRMVALGPRRIPSLSCHVFCPHAPLATLFRFAFELR